MPIRRVPATHYPLPTELETMSISKVKVFGIPLNKRTAVRWKIYLDRARMYLNYINFVMIAFVFLSAIEDARLRQILDENRLIIYPVVMLIFIGVSLILGYFDTKLGLRKEEMRNNATENPVTLEILTHLRELKAEIADLKREKN